MSNITFPIVVAGFSSSLIYQVSKENDFLCWKKLRQNKSHANCTGYYFRQRCMIKGIDIFHCLLVQNGNVFFISKNSIFDVTSESWKAFTYRKGLFKSVFKLFNDDKKIMECEYFEIAQTKADEMDCHFFVDVSHWLRSQESKQALDKYWQGVLL